jgi:hypothetical protein
MRKLPGGDDLQRINVVNEAALVANGDAVPANENKFGMRDLKLLPVRCANCKRTETAAAHPLFQLLNIHALNLNQPSIRVKIVPIISLGKSHSCRTCRAAMAGGHFRISSATIFRNCAGS